MSLTRAIVGAVDTIEARRTSRTNSRRTLFLPGRFNQGLWVNWAAAKNDQRRRRFVVVAARRGSALSKIPYNSASSCGVSSCLHFRSDVSKRPRTARASCCKYRSADTSLMPHARTNRKRSWTHVTARHGTPSVLYGLHADRGCLGLCSFRPCHWSKQLCGTTFLATTAPVRRP